MKTKVLCVDDEVNLLRSLKRNLRGEQYDLLTATSAEEGLDILEKNDIAVVVSDQNMPGMEGTEFLRRVHEKFPDSVRIMLTGNATIDVAIEAINEGAISRLLTKPCDTRTLALAIRQGLEQRQLLRAAARLLDEARSQREMLNLAKWEHAESVGDRTEAIVRGQLEDSHPGISQVNVDHDGAVLADHDVSLGDLLKEVEDYFGSEPEGLEAGATQEHPV